MAEMHDINIRSILNVQGEYCVSLYMPTTRVATDWNENSIRLKNLIRKAEEKLQQLHADKGLIESLTKPLREFQQDTRFLQSMKSGAIFFSGPDFFQYHLLPVEVQESAVISDRFYTKPLIYLSTYNTSYYLLALSKHEVSLYKADRFSLTKVDVPDLPENMETYLRFDDDREQLQYHTGTPPQGEKRAAVYHGQGVGSDKGQEKERSTRYIQGVEQAVSRALSEKKLPLVLFTVDYLEAIYRKENSYEHLVKESAVHGSPDRLNHDELLREGWKTAEKIAEQRILDAVQDFHNERDDNKTIGALKDVVPAAYSGRVQTIFVSYEDLIWGAFDEESTVAEAFDEWRPGAVELLDAAVRFTWLNGGGNTYVLAKEHMPRNAEIAVVYRY